MTLTERIQCLHIHAAKLQRSAFKTLFIFALAKRPLTLEKFQERSGFYERRAIEMLRLLSSNFPFLKANSEGYVWDCETSERFYELATAYWEKAQRDLRLQLEGEQQRKAATPPVI